MQKDELIKLIKTNLEPPCISVYLSFKSENPTTAEMLAAFNSLVRRETRKDSTLKKEDFKLYFDELRKAIRLLRLPGGNFQGVSFFMAPARKYIRNFFLRKCPEILCVSSSFYLLPIIKELYETLTFCFCIVDERKARLVALSPYEVLREVKIDDQTPERVKSAGWYGLEEKRIGRHINEHVRAHFELVVSKVRELWREYGFQILVLFLSTKNAQIFKKMLSFKKAFLVVEKPPLDFNTSTDLIRKLAGEIERAELEKERLLVREKLEIGLSEGRAVVGLQAFLRAWNEGLVEKVLIKENFESGAFFCSNCNRYQIEAGSCSFCGTDLEKISYFLDHIVKECFIKNVKAYWFRDFSPGLAAILRTYLF